MGLFKSKPNEQLQRIESMLTRIERNLHDLASNLYSFNTIMGAKKEYHEVKKNGV